jgi:hypothetical protein
MTTDGSGQPEIQPPQVSFPLDAFGLPVVPPARLNASDWLPLGSAASGAVAIGLGLTDVIAYGVLRGYLVVLGIVCGVLGLGLAVHAEKRPKSKAASAMLLAGRLGVAGALLLVSGSGNGRYLNDG